MFLYSLCVVSSLSFMFTHAKNSEDAVYTMRNPQNIYKSLAVLKKSKIVSPYNIATDKDEVTVLVPKFSKLVPDESKQHRFKKYPKKIHVIQKIIKKSKKSKKCNLMTSTPTQATRYEQKETLQTTQPTMKKKTRKYNIKYARYPMPFQYKSKDTYTFAHRRTRRNVDDDNKGERELFVLQDLDEIQFLSKENDINTIKAHVKRPW